MRILNILLCIWCFASINAQVYPTIKLENDKVELIINQRGGAISSFLYKNNNLNPLSWKLNKEQMPTNNQVGEPFAGHFLCTGRWGSPTIGEINSGVPHNGQANNLVWEILHLDSLKCTMAVHAPLDNLYIIRMIVLDGSQPVFFVKEEFVNTSSVARLNNIVQHVTIGPPFLTTKTIIYSNAGKGFLQTHSYPTPHKHSYDWPNAVDSTGKVIALNTHSDMNYVSTHLVKGKTGYVAGYTPQHAMGIGYFWDTKEYAWLNIWNQTKNNKPIAKGLEFGTTGIGKPYQDLLEVDTRFMGENSFFVHDAGERITKRYAGFLFQPNDNQELDKYIEQTIEKYKAHEPSF